MNTTEKLHTEEVDLFFEAVLSLKNKEECYPFFEDICTVKELLDIAQRFRVASLLQEGTNYTEIGRLTGASTATISRVNKSLEYGCDGYKLVLERLKNKTQDQK